MNAEIIDYYRAQILKGLMRLPEEWQMTFKRMYSHKDLMKDIKDVVSDMPVDKLDWALSQVQNSIKSIEQKLK